MNMLSVGVAACLVCGIPGLAAAKTIVVSADGKGDYKTVQEALAAVPDNSAERTVIHIKAGTYDGPFVVAKSKANVTLEGDSPAKTILTWLKDYKC